MIFVRPICFLAFSMIIALPLSAQDDWARWRGPNGNGIAEPGQQPPVDWSESKNVIWKAKVPGRGHASPIIVDQKIFLTTADQQNQTQSVLCYDRKTGKQLWSKVINTGGLPGRIHPKNTHASPTIATDRKHLFAVFNHDGIVDVTALTMAGEVAWNKSLGAYAPKFSFGFGASPIVHGSTLFVSNEGGANASITAFNCESGDELFKISRAGNSSYSTPVVAKVGGKEQLFISGGQTVKSYSPKDGSQNWVAQAQWAVSCGTMVWDGDMVFASGGYPAQQTLGIDAQTGKVRWTNGVKVYEQSMLAHDGYVYAHSDNGALYCWRAADGQQMWRNRFSSRRVAVSASPVLANGNIYFTAENGETVVIKANPKAYEEVARNQLGNSGFASQAFCGDKIFARVGIDGQEWLFCLGTSK